MVGIVILNYNSWNDTEACIKSIDEHEKQVQYHIYVVDNASTIPMPAEFLTELKGKNFTFISSSDNRGYSAGNNLGIRRALMDGCNAILISNADVRYEKNSIGNLYKYLQEHTDVGIVGPKIKLPDGSTQKECMCRKTGVLEKYLLRTRAHLLFPRYNKKYWGREHDYEKDTFLVYAVLGCCFMMSRRCAEDITPLDENTFLYEEELIIGIRMENSGWKTVYYPRSIIHHLHGQTTKKIKAFAYACNVASEIYYCKRYLNLKNWQIQGLYVYRTLVYLLKGVKSKEYRNSWNCYRKKTKIEFRRGWKKC